MSPIYDPKRHHQILLVVVPSAPGALPGVVASSARVLVVYLTRQSTCLSAVLHVCGRRQHPRNELIIARPRGSRPSVSYTIKIVV